MKHLVPWMMPEFLRFILKNLMNRCQFSKFKFINCGLAEIFLVKELDHTQDFV